MSGDVPSVPDDARKRHAYQLETVAMCDELERLIFPPWRWLAWLRLYRTIKARNAAVRDSLRGGAK